MKGNRWKGRLIRNLDFDNWSVPEPNTGCLLWLGHSFDRYGVLRVRGKYMRAHRFAYERINGPIGAGLCVLHRCDTPMCVNPEHLFLGTQKDNMLDRERKGRGSVRAALKARWPNGAPPKRYLGVRMSIDGVHYQAFIQPKGDGSRVNVGRFSDPLQAAAARDAAAMGSCPRARLNFPRL